MLLFVTGLNIFGNAFIAAFDVEENTAFIIVDQFVESLFLLDIIFSFFQEYLDEETYMVVSDLVKIGKNYLKGSFIFDLLAWLPFDLLLHGLDSEKHDRIWRLLKLLRLPRLA